MSNQELKEGDVVQLKSGGVEMTLAKLIVNNAKCYWADGKEIRYREIPLAALKLSKSITSNG